MNRQDLDDYKNVAHEIEQLQDRIKTLESSLYAPGIQKITGMPISHSVDKDKLGESIARLEELRKRYLDKLEKLCDGQKMIEDAIETLPPDERMILRYRYVDGLYWRDVFKKCKYMSRETIKRKHKKALRKILDPEKVEPS